MNLFSGPRELPQGWINLVREEQLDELVAASYPSNLRKAVIIFKHSTRCSISNRAFHGLEVNWDLSPEETPFYYLDLLRYRILSNRVAALFSVTHESPQLLIIKEGRCVFNRTHSGIAASEVKDFVRKV